MPDSFTPEARARAFTRAFLEAALHLDRPRIVAMAAAVNWRWRGDVIDHIMVAKTIMDLHSWATATADWSRPVSIASPYTGGVHLIAHESPAGIDDRGEPYPASISVEILWGESSEGEANA